LHSFKKSSAIIVIGAIVLGAFLSKISLSAASNSAVLTGSCGFLLQRSFGGFGNAQVGYNFTHNLIGIINFDKSTASGTLNQLFNYQQTNANIVTTSTSNMPIVITDGPFTGAYYISFSTNDPQPLIIVPVNGGNSFLLSQKIPANANGNDPALTGVCQKI